LPISPGDRNIKILLDHVFIISLSLSLLKLFERVALKGQSHIFFNVFT